MGRSSRLHVVLCGAVSIACLGAFPGVGGADDKAKKPAAKESKAASKAAPKEASRAPDFDLAKLRLPKPGYGDAIRRANTDAGDSAGVKATIEIAPDAFAYYMAVGMDELSKASYGKVELVKKLRELHAKNKRLKGKAAIFLKLSSGGGKDHHFVQSSMKQHLVLRGTSAKTIAVSDEDPKPALAAWRVFEQKANERNMLQKKLSEFKDMACTITLDYKPEEKDPLTLSCKDLVRVTDRREEQKTDFRAFESINVGLKQISSSDWKSQIVPDIVFKLFPGKWQIPELPEEYQEILSVLEAKS